jgi:hypothetical protein
LPNRLRINHANAGNAPPPIPRPSPAESHRRTASPSKSDSLIVAAVLNQEIKSVGDTAGRNWTAVRAKVAADIDALKAGVARAKHDLDARHAESYAERLEWEAGVAIDYAIASVEQAKLAVLDAVSSRAEAEKAKTS